MGRFLRSASLSNAKADPGVSLIDSIGQIHLEESCLAPIPGVDEYEDIR